MSAGELADTVADMGQPGMAVLVVKGGIFEASDWVDKLALRGRSAAFYVYCVQHDVIDKWRRREFRVST